MPNLHLCDLDLNKNQLIKPVIHLLTGNPTHAVEGQIYYHTSNNTIYVCTVAATNSDGTNSTWLNLGDIGDITSVQDGNGLTGGADSGGVTLAVGQGAGVTVSTNAVAITAAQTAITSILNTSLTKVGTASNQEYITFGTSNEVNTFVNNTERLSVTATGVDITGALTVSGSYGLASGDIPNNAADTTGEAGTVASIGNLTGEVTSTNRGTIIGDNKVDEANLKVSNGPTNGYVLSAQSGDTGGLTWVNSASSTQTLTNKTIAASQVTEISNITAAEGAQLEKIGTATISATQWGYLGNSTGAITNVSTDLSLASGTGARVLSSSDGDNATFPVATTSVSGLMSTGIFDAVEANTAKVTNTDANVSIATLTTRLSELTENVTIGDATDVQVTIAGNLVVQGSTTTVNSTNLNLEDHNIILDSNNNSAAVVNGAGFTIEGGNGSDATFTYNTSGPKFEMKLGSNYEDLKVDTLHAAALTIPDNAIAVAKIAAGTLPSDVKINNANWSGTDLAAGNGGTGVSSTTAYKNLLDDETWTFANNVTLSAGLVIAGHTVNDIDVNSDTSDANDHLMTAIAIKNRIDDLISVSNNIRSRSYNLIRQGGVAVDGVVASNGDKTFTITHGLGNSMLYMIQVVQTANGSGATVFPCVTRTSTTIVINFNTPPTSGDMTVLLNKIGG